jgi:hypothetical protein
VIPYLLVAISTMPANGSSLQAIFEFTNLEIVRTMLDRKVVIYAERPPPDSREAET